MGFKPSVKFVKTLQAPAPGVLKLSCSADAQDHFENLCDTLTNGKSQLAFSLVFFFLNPNAISCNFKIAHCARTVKLNSAREVDYWYIKKWPFHVHYSVVTPLLSLFCIRPLFKPLICTQVIPMTATLPFMGVCTFSALLNFLDNYPIWTQGFPYI